MSLKSFIKYKKNKWRITKINEGFEMTRINGKAIECRKLNWFEKIIYRKKCNKELLNQIKGKG